MSDWEQRWHPLREEWVIVSAHRQDRPWRGEVLAGPQEPIPDYSPDCSLCPGNLRSSGERNPHYTGTFAFNNDHPCVAPDAPALPPSRKDVYISRPATGVARVVCYSPSHNLTLAEMEPVAVQQVVTTWQKELRELAARPQVRHVLIFENKGEVVGVSNPHPHGQIYATNFVFKTIENEVHVCERHYRETGRVLFQEILESELQDGGRIICENTTAVAFIPYFARYAYEVFVAPKMTHPHIAALTDPEVVDFADALLQVLIKFDNLWGMSFPYVMPLHQAPTDSEDYRFFHFHIEFHPPLRKPSLLKYLAGPEIGGGNFLSDTVPEEKAAELKTLPDVHYRKQSR